MPMTVHNDAKTRVQEPADLPDTVRSGDVGTLTGSWDERKEETCEEPQSARGECAGSRKVK